MKEEMAWAILDFNELFLIIPSLQSNQISLVEYYNVRKLEYMNPIYDYVVHPYLSQMSVPMYYQKQVIPHHLAQAAVPTRLIVASGLNPISSANGTKIVAIIGIVEKDEPIPIVTRRPTMSINNAPSDLLSPIMFAAL